MKHAISLLLFSCVLLSFCSCRSAKNNAESVEPSQESGISSMDASDEASETDAPDEPNSKAPQPESLPAQTDPAAEQPTETLFPLPASNMPAYHGEGGEDFAETPLPEYFAYRIYENGFSARLAGGNYQSMQLPAECPPLLSGAEQEYSLFDSDFDGDYDLSIRIKADYGQLAYAVFFWNGETKKYDEAPTVLYNPRYDAENKTVISLQQADDKNVYLAIYLGSPQSPFEWCHAEYSTLTLYGPALYEQSNLPKTQYDSEDALTDALMEIYQHYIPSVRQELLNPTPN